MLPGKLCIGILEEDNPLKSYFRLKPLLVENDGKYEPFEGGAGYPEEGCIRIVPDKNESSHFKARMRRMGRYCVLDLREHAGENDKIRPNKNYRGDDSERNANIVYSDVVREPAEDMIFEILPEAWTGERTATRRVLRGDGLQTWVCASEGEEAALQLDGDALAEAEIQRFELPGFPGETQRFAIRLPGLMQSVIGVPALREEARVEVPVMPIAPAVPVAPEQTVKAQPEPNEPEKPWISHDLPPVNMPYERNMSPLDRALAAQSGLNPKRNRSLQEIIDEKWRHSRVEQLGHPVPGNAMGQPLENPLDRALDALRGALRIPEIHERLVNSIAEMQEFSLQLEHRRADLTKDALRRELEDMEAERLKTLHEIERLRREKNALRETFKQEIRAEEARDLREALEKTRAAKQEQHKYEMAAQEAREAAEFAKDAFNALNDGRFEDKLMEFALTSRAAELLRHPEWKLEPAVLPSQDRPDRREWIERLCRSFAMEGLELDEIAAANLLICAALGESLILSGRASSDKRAVGRALARALGAVDSNCYREISAVKQCAGDVEMQNGDLPGVIMVRDANCAAEALSGCGWTGNEKNRIVIYLVADDGCPVPAELLEHSFLLRTRPVSAQAPWKAENAPDGSFSPVSMDALKTAFRADDEILPPALERRLQKLRDALALHGVYLSRSALDRMWKYCAAMLKVGKISAGEALDMAFAQTALPCILAEAPLDCLMELKNLLNGMPHSLALLDLPLPIRI